MGDYTEHLISMAGGDGDDALDLDAIQARADAATEGPWEVVTGMHQPIIYSGGSGLDIAIMDDRDGVGADAEFIANAPADMNVLLALVREQAAQIERAEALADSFDERASQASYFGTEEQMEAWLSAANCIRAAITATEES